MKKLVLIDAVGFVPLRDIVGKVRQVYYSSGENGVRWGRIGKTVGGEGQ